MALALSAWHFIVRYRAIRRTLVNDIRLIRLGAEEWIWRFDMSLF